MTAVRVLTALIALAVALPVDAQSRRPSHCIAIADAAPGEAVLWRAAWGDPLPAETVRLSYVGHSTYYLETPGGLSVATDYTGILGPADVVPDVVTMNRAHSSHWTSDPDERIPNVLQGWDWTGEPADHHLDLGEMLVRNVPTDIRRQGGGVDVAGNSIFVFEVAGLCIGHLGHLHHEPTDAQYAALGRLDVVMVPVDGGMTLDLPTMIAVVKRLRSSIVLPMHWFGPVTLSAFLTGMEDEFLIDIREGSSLDVSLKSLPSRPTVIVLAPRQLE